MIKGHIGVISNCAKNKIFLAFTLAEVLITLGIVGIVAEMTIPTLMNNVQNQAFLSALKKAYTQYNQVLAQMAADAGCPGDLKCSGLFNTGTDTDTLGAVFIKYVKVAKNCGTTTNMDCFPQYTNMAYDGTSISDQINTISGYKVVTADGMSVFITNSVNNCSTDNSSGATGNLRQTCGSFYVDVNGLNGPNRAGRDSFHFYITNGKGPLLYPEGGKDDNSFANAWWNNSSHQRCVSDDTRGYQCAARIMEEGWKMNY